MSEGTVTRTQLLAALRAAGIESGDTLMVHSSLKSFGKVDGGPDAVIDALLDAVGPRGHVTMPALTNTYSPDSLSGVAGFAFHPAKTPSRVGAITDRFWRRPGAVRSGHPTHSIACIGPHAVEWMAGHERISTFGWEGPYAKYVRAEGGPSKLVFLGVTLTCNTTLHAVEDWLDLPYLMTAEAMVEVHGTPEKVTVTKAPLGCRGFYKSADRHHKLMEATGLIRHAQAGNATLSILDARRCVQETVRQELASPGALLCLRPECAFCAQGRARIVPIQEQVRARAHEMAARGLSS